MKKEPLKGKEWIPMPNEKDEPLFRGKDIKSAVEWLKAVVEATRDDMPTKLFKSTLLKVIDEAFEDVVEKWLRIKRAIRGFVCEIYTKDI